MPQFAEYAGGYLSAATVDGTRAKNTVGCYALKGSAGNYAIFTDQPTPPGKFRAWASCNANGPFLGLIVSTMGRNPDWLVLTYTLSADPITGNMILTATDEDVSFGIELIPAE